MIPTADMESREELEASISVVHYLFFADIFHNLDSIFRHLGFSLSSETYQGVTVSLWNRGPSKETAWHTFLVHITYPHNKVSRRSVRIQEAIGICGAFVPHPSARFHIMFYYWFENIIFLIGLFERHWEIRFNEFNVRYQWCMWCPWKYIAQNTCPSRSQCYSLNSKLGEKINPKGLLPAQVLLVEKFLRTWLSFIT